MNKSNSYSVGYLSAIVRMKDGQEVRPPNDVRRIVRTSKKGEYFCFYKKRVYIVETKHPYGVVLEEDLIRTGVFHKLFHLVDPNSTMYGWKILTQLGTTPPNMHTDNHTVYNLPNSDEKWGKWMKHPSPQFKKDFSDCGGGGYHILITRSPNSDYAPDNWWPWFAEIRGVIGVGINKARGQEIRLRRIMPDTFYKMVSSGKCNNSRLVRAYLKGIRFHNSRIRDLDLSDANMSGTYAESSSFLDVRFNGANIRISNFEDCKFDRCHFDFADLSNSNFMSTSFFSATLTTTNLRSSHFSNCDFRLARFGDSSLLEYATFTNCDLTGAVMPIDIMNESRKNGCKFGLAKMKIVGHTARNYRFSARSDSVFYVSRIYSDYGLENESDFGRAYCNYSGFNTIDDVRNAWKNRSVFEFCYYTAETRVEL